nr:hypothetical protein [Paludibacterium denitrificans]
MYPVPPKAETQGLTERYIGTGWRRADDATRWCSPPRSPGR